MKRNLLIPLALTASVMTGLRPCPAQSAEPSLKQTMDDVVKRLYATMDEKALASLTPDTVLKLFTDDQRKVLATKYWYFDVNVPVVVSVIRNVDQPVVPFWLAPAGFAKTDLVVKNEEWSYEVWQKPFNAGRVELGINGFDMHRTVYFVCVGAQQPGVSVKITNLFPPGEAVITMKKGAWTYRDWDDLYIEELPKSLEGQLLLTTYRGRAREAHLIGAFRRTPFPSSARPDQVVLTWSENPRTTQTIQWRTNPSVKHALVRYRRQAAKDAPWTEVKATCEVIEDRLLMNDRYVHRHTAVLRGLMPATAYVYCVGAPENDVWSDQAEFRTAPDGDAPFSFVTFGDTHRRPEWGQLIQAVDKRHPETAFYAIAGDVVSTGLFRDDWDKLLGYSGDVLAHRPLAFSLGNHDDQDGLGAWMPLALFEFPRNGPKGVEPERTFSFRYGNALFLVLDVGTPYEIQAKWMERQLAETDATWRLAIYHFPMYCFKEDDEYGPIRRRWEEVFAKHHLDMMLHGHVHHYLRTRPMRNGAPVASPADGTIYVISLGIPDRQRPRKLPDFAVKYMSGGPWCQKFDVAGKRLVYRVYDMAGKVCDELVIRK
ncbi:MAG: metallophosphoesterase family protein [Phycisphaerae bacterium]|nr:metallophosphoesterase family protein [Phycisphaerae bacterium]